MKNMWKWLHAGLWTLLLLLAGCSEPEKPESAARAYAEDWQQLQFGQMYVRLSEASKQAVSEENFVKRYQTIYDGIEASDIRIQLELPEPGTNPPAGDRIVYPLHVSLTTGAGPVEFDKPLQLVKEKHGDATGWFVEWDSSMIFPSLKEGDKVAVQKLKAVRGEIRDRSGQGLAVNGTYPLIGLVPEKLGDSQEESLTRLGRLLHISADDIRSKLEASWAKPGLFVPVAPLPAQVNLDEVLDIPGTDYQEKEVRSYPLGEAAAHLTGYVQPVSAEELAKLKDKGYSSDDVIGKTGLEQTLEGQLRGKDGMAITIVDAQGKVKETLARREPVNGRNVQVTIDAGLQKSIYGQMQEDSGAAAAISPTSGEILALVSSPSYDPNLFVQGVTAAQWKQWNEDPRRPLMNRFNKGYAPGSVFKTITAAAGLAANVTAPDKIRHIQGLRWTKDASWGSYYITRVKDESSVNLQDALVWSDNIYFAQEALEMGKETFEKGVKPFGFDAPLDLPFPFERASLSNQGIQSEIQLADSAYGQGEVLMSPLHLALAYTPFVNDGRLLDPVLLAEAGETGDGIRGKQVVRPGIAQLLEKDLTAVVDRPDGTCHGVYLPELKIAAKSGTAELKASKGEDGRENGWFVGFDTENPRLLLAMMIEDVKGRGGSGYVVKKAKPLFAEMGR